jgi:hypothetical protein
LLVISPFLANYVKSTILETSQVVGYEETLSILQERFVTMSLPDPVSTLVSFFTGRTAMGMDLIWYMVWVLGIGGIVFGLMQKNSEENAPLRQIAAWLTGILIIGGFVPVLERIIFAYLKRIPPEFEITRTLRYTVPLILLAGFYALWLTRDSLQRKNLLSPMVAQYFFVGASITLLVAWGMSGEVQRREFRGTVKQNISCWIKGNLLCPLPESSMDFIRVMDALREKTPVGSRIFSEGQEVAIRYYALRPLAYTYKDGAPLAYTDQQQLLAWNEQAKTMEKLAFMRKFPFRHKGFVRGMAELARKTQADYLILQEPYCADCVYPEQLSLIYTNGHYSLYELTP